MDLHQELAAVIEAFCANQIPYALVGGLAVSLYFSFAVWFSIAMVHSPRALRRQARSVVGSHASTQVRDGHGSPALGAPAE